MALSPTSERPMTQALELHLKQVGAQIRLGPYVVDQMRVEERMDHIAHELAYAVRTYVQVQHIADNTYTHVEHFPATWWQHWKDAHNGRLARWLKKRKPVKYKDVTLRVDIESMAAFPDSSIIVDPKLGRPMLWQVVDKSVSRA